MRSGGSAHALAAASSPVTTTSSRVEFKVDDSPPAMVAIDIEAPAPAPAPADAVRAQDL